MKFSHRFAICILALALPHAKAQKPANPEGVTVVKDVAYLAHGRKEKADLYLPAKRAKDVRSPAVVIIHGGGWIQNKKDDRREIGAGTTLAKKGYVCLSINYWMGEKEAPLWPRNVQDCQNAVR